MTTRLELLRRGGLARQRITAVAGSHVKIGGRWVLNFTSSTYLGLHRHPLVRHALAGAAATGSSSLGIPRVLGVDGTTGRLEAQIARLVRQDRALVFASTTHLALDVLPLLAGSRGTIVIDERAYPLSFQGAFAAGRHGAAIVRFAHNDPAALQQTLQTQDHRRPIVIVCDGVYAAGGYPAALRPFERLARRYRAMLYLDDAHGIGVLGARPAPDRAYGLGGAGTPAYSGIEAGALVHVGSLSKAFGVPLAFVAGPSRVIEQAEATASSFVHASPPAPPIVAAASAVLHVHAMLGAATRRRLLHRVLHFRAGLRGCGGFSLGPSMFPLQTLYFETPQAALVVACELRAHDIWPVVQLNPPDHPVGGALRFAITALHTPAEIDRAVVATSSALRKERSAKAREGRFIPRAELLAEAPC